MSNDRIYISRDGLISVIVSHSCLSEMIRISENTNGNEIGSVLIGHYSKDGYSAFVEGTRPPPPGSIGRRMSFCRAARGISSFFNQLFRISKGRKYYIGEWHLHPGGSVNPSVIDDQTMVSISKDHNSCGFISIILGGSSLIKPQVGVSVYFKDSRVDLIERRL